MKIKCVIQSINRIKSQFNSIERLFLEQALKDLHLANFFRNWFSLTVKIKNVRYSSVSAMIKYLKSIKNNDEITQKLLNSAICKLKMCKGKCSNG